MKNKENMNIFWLKKSSHLELCHLFTCIASDLPIAPDNILINVNTCAFHCENAPIQIYRKFHLKKLKFSDKNSDIFHISAQKIDCRYLLELPH